MIKISIKLQTARGIKARLTDEEAQILSYYVKQLLEWHHVINPETVAKYTETVRIIREGMPHSQTVDNALFWLKTIGDSRVEVKDVEVKAL